MQMNIAKFSRRSLPCLAAALAAACASATAYAQASGAGSKPEPDVLVFTDGEKLIGQLVRAKGGSVTFKSDMAGEITVDWKKIQELRTSHPFAVIPKNVHLAKHVDTGQVPEGNLTMHDQKIEVQTAAGAAPHAVPVADAGFVVGQPEFEKAINGEEGFFRDWGGTVTAGVSLVEATQKADTFTGSISLVRVEPSENWLNPSNRTLFDFSGSYGKVSQPGVPDIKTDIVHVDAERDEFFSARLFGFGQIALDHNFSQGLDLQQLYGGGLGWTAVKTGTQEFDLKASVDYIHQNFQISASNQSLVGSTFAEIYTRKLAHGVVFNEQISVLPAWNNSRAYSATGLASLSLPVHKRFSLVVSSLDTFLNDPPPGFKKNSFQFTTGLTYALR